MTLHSCLRHKWSSLIYYQASSVEKLDSDIEKQRVFPVTVSPLSIILTSLLAIFFGGTVLLKQSPSENCSQYNLGIRTNTVDF